MTGRNLIGPLPLALVGLPLKHHGLVLGAVNALRGDHADFFHEKIAEVLTLVPAQLDPPETSAAPPAILKPVSTIINPKRQFDPSIFGTRWTIWLGLENGDGLSGEIECDPRSMELVELDLSLAEPTVILRGGESYTTGAEQIARVKKEKAGHIRLDPSFALALRAEPEKYPEAWKGKVVFWDGLTLRSPLGPRCSVYSIWRDGGVELRCRWRDDDLRRGADHPSALLASKPLAPVV